MNGGNRLRRAASLVLALAVTAGSALAAGEEYIRVEDTVRSDPSCRVFDLAGDGEFPETFSYDVPEGGVTALIFFKNGCWNCANLFRGLSVLTEDPRVNVTAVSMQDRAETQSFADAYIGDKLERVYYQPVSYQNPGWAYVDLLSGRDGGRVSMETAFVVLVTEEDGTRWIRWYGMSVSNAQAVKDRADDLLGGTPEEPEGLPASASFSEEDCGGGTASFAASVANRSSGALSGRLWAAGYAGGRQTDLESRALMLAAGGSCTERFAVTGEGARLFLLDGDLRPLMKPLEAGRP